MAKYIHMSDDLKKQEGDQRTEPEAENRPETKLVREIGSLSSTVMDLIAKKRTNPSSGSLDESKPSTCEIDFGEEVGVESRLKRLPTELLAQAQGPTAFKPSPRPISDFKPVPAPQPIQQSELHPKPSPTPHIEIKKGELRAPLPKPELADLEVVSNARQSQGSWCSQPSRL